MDTTTPQQATDKINGWQAAAEDANASAPSTQPSPAQAQGTEPPAAPAPSQQQKPDAAGQPGTSPSFPQTTPPPQTTITPLKRGGLMGVIDDVADALAGKSAPEFGVDGQGNKYVKERTLSRGEQWARIGVEAARGAAAGYAAGQGAGGEGRAAAAGFQVGDRTGQQQQQQRQEMNAEARQQNLDNANNLMTRMKLAEESWKNTRMGVEASQHDVEFAQGQEDRLVKEGGTVLGHMQSPGDISAIKSVNPDVFKDLIDHQRVELVPHYDGDGRRAGFTVVKMPDGYRSNLLPAGTEFKTFDPTTGQYLTHKTSDPITAGEVDDYNAKAALDATTFAGKKAEADLKAAQTAHTNAQAETENQNRPNVIAKTKSEAIKNRAEAIKAQIEGRVASQGAEENSPEQMGRMLFNGDIDQTQLSKRSKTYDATIQAANRIAMQETGRPFSLGEAAAKYKAKRDLIDAYGKGKQGDQIQTFNTFLAHAQNLSDTIANLRRTNSPLLNKSINWLEKNTGQPGVQGLLTDIAAVRTEYQNFLNNNHALHESDIREGHDLLNPDMGPAAMEGAVKSFGTTALARLGALNSRYKRVVGSDVPDLLDGTSQQAIQTLGLTQDAQRYIGGPQQQPQPAAQQWSAAAWQRANPGGDVNAATAAAKAQHFEVLP